MAEEAVVTVAEESSGLGETSTGISRPSWMGSDESASDDAVAANSESKAEETGKDPEKKDNDKSPDGGDDTKPPPKKDEPANDKEDGTDKDTDEEPEAKAPKGYVPQAALTEARAKKNLVADELAATKEQLDEALSKVQELESAPFKAAPSTFEKKSEDDLREMIQDGEDEEVLQYYKDLKAHEKGLVEDQKLQQEQGKIDEHFRVQTAIAEEEISTILGDDAQIAEITERLGKEGFGDELYFLVNPKTRVVADDGKTLVPLANHASALLSVLSKLGSTSTTEITEVDQVPDAIRQKIIAEEQQNILEKVKGTQRRTSLDDISTAASDSDESEFAGKTYAELTEEERKRYTAGG